MKKKLLIPILVLALIIGMSTLALARPTFDAPVPRGGEATVTISPGDLMQVCPSRVPLEWNIAPRLNLYFGTVPIEPRTVHVYSRGQLTETAGYALLNGTGDSFKVTVQLGRFFIDDAATMYGASIRLTPFGYKHSIPDSIIETFPITLTSAAAGTPEHYPQKIISGDGYGFFASNFSSRLTVLAGTAVPGEARATMIWTLQPDDNH